MESINKIYQSTVYNVSVSYRNRQRGDRMKKANFRHGFFQL